MSRVHTITYIVTAESREASVGSWGPQAKPRPGTFYRRPPSPQLSPAAMRRVGLRPYSAGRLQPVHPGQRPSGAGLSPRTKLQPQPKPQRSSGGSPEPHSRFIVAVDASDVDETTHKRQQAQPVAEQQASCEQAAEPAASEAARARDMEAASASSKALRTILPVDRSEWLTLQPEAWQQEAIPGLALDEPVLSQLQARSRHRAANALCPGRAMMDVEALITCHHHALLCPSCAPTIRVKQAQIS